MTDNKVQHRYQTLLLYEQGLMTSSVAANSIGISERQFFRLWAKFRESGRKIESLKYRSHPAWNRTPKEAEHKILKLNQDYPEALNSHLGWLAYDVYGIKINPPCVRNILIRNGCYIPFKEKLQKAYRKFQATQFGALVQLDTKDGYWLKEYPMLHLILALDDATRTILAGGIYEHDSTLNNMLVIKEIIRGYGVPALFYTDNDSKFRVIRHGRSRYYNYSQKVLDGQTETEIRRALEEVGSGLITHLAYHPQSKGKIEKLIRYARDCFLNNH